jgi:hypothetical protein
MSANIKGGGFGYHFQDIVAGADCVEFHVDYWNCLTAEEQETAAGGPTSAVPMKEPSMSIRVSSKAKPVMIIRQDESVFAQ